MNLLAGIVLNFCGFSVGTCFKSDLNKHVNKCAIKNKDNPNEKEIERLKTRLLVQEIKIGILEKLSQRVRVNVNL